MHAEKRNEYRALLGEPQSKKPLEKPIHKCEDNIKMGPRDAETVDVY
jgi:hypothetical protein